MIQRRMKRIRTRKLDVRTCLLWLFSCVMCMIILRPLRANLQFRRSLQHSHSSVNKQYHRQLDAKGASSRGSSNLNFVGSSGDNDSDCEGKRVYMYELPTKFNTDLAERELCRNGLVDWLDLCSRFGNGGFGEKLEVKDDGQEEYWAWSDWYATDAYMLEVIFHSRMQAYPCRTYNPSKADSFFIPWYGGLAALPWLYTKRVTVLTRGRFGMDILQWLQENDHDLNSGSGSGLGEWPWWRRYGGKDHFVVLGRTVWDFLGDEGDLDKWGAGFFALPYAQNITSLMLESRRSDWFDNERTIPYPTSFHPSSPKALSRWIQRVKSSQREYLMSYVGAGRPEITDSVRGIIQTQCLESKEKCSFVDCSKMKCSREPIPIATSFLRSDFCLQPRGDTSTRRSTLDCLIAGAIPVFFHEDTAYTQYSWHLPDNRESYSVFISETQIRDGLVLARVLERYSPEKIREMRKTIVTLIPALVYNNYANAPHSKIKDAFEVSIEGVIDRVAAYKNSHPARA